MADNNLELKRFAIDNLIVLSRIVSMTVFALVVSIILARGLGTAGKGQYELVMLLLNFVGGTIFNLGIPVSTVRFTAAKNHDLKTIVSTNMALVGLLTVGAMLTGAVTIVYGADTLLSGVPQSLLFTGLFLLPFYMVFQHLHTVFNGLQDFRSVGLVDTTQPLVTAVVLVLLALAGSLNIFTALFALAAGYFCADLVILLRLNAYLSNWRDFVPRLNLGYARDLFAYSLKIYAIVIVNTLLLRIDLFFITNLGGGPASVGIYSIAVTLGERVWTFSGFTNTVLMPRIASWDNEDHKRDQLTLLSGKYTIWISLLVALALIVFGRPLIGLIYPSEFIRSYDALLALIPGILMYNLARLFGSDLVGRGKGGSATPIVVAITLLNIALNIVLVPTYDFIGASLASSAAYSLYGLILAWLFFRQSGLRWLDLFVPTTDDTRRIRSLFGLVRQHARNVLRRR